MALPSLAYAAQSGALLGAATRALPRLAVGRVARFEHVTVPVPEMTESISEGTVQTFKKQVGHGVAEEEVVAVLDTDKISIDVVSPVSGRIIELKAGDGDAVAVGDPLFVVDTDLKGDDSSASAASSGSSASAAAPAEFGVNKRGPDGAREERRVPMTRMRQRIAERLKQSQTEGVCLTTFNEVDMSSVMALRKKLQAEVQKQHGVKLGFMSFFLAACTQALEEFPCINNAIEGKDVLERNFVDISVAVATPTGLMVPVVRDCERKSLVELEKAVLDLAGRARDNKIQVDEMAGGNFTISNGGTYGSLFGTPVINPPQSAILGMHGIQQRPVARDGQVVIRPMMYLALTYDHRLVDGREAVLFLKKVQELLENPDRLLEKTQLA